MYLRLQYLDLEALDSVSTFSFDEAMLNETPAG
jgi:hypothetical protein